jgi:hypothetical protein
MNPHWSDRGNRMAKGIARAGRGRLHSSGKQISTRGCGPVKGRRDQ